MPGFFRNEENITLYDKAFLPVSTTIGTPYTCNQKDIDLLFQGRARLHHDIPVFKNFITRDEATAKLERFSHSCSLDLPDENKEAVDKLKRLVGDGLPTIWGPDIVFKCFKDLDRVFFKGRLTGYTKLAWVNSADMNIRVPSGSTVFACSGCCGMLGTTWTKAYASIQLNAENIYLMETCSFTTPEEGSHRFRVYGCFRFMLGILLHEMVVSPIFNSTPSRSVNIAAHVSLYRIWACNRQRAA